MASTIVTKNSSTASAVPLTGDLTQGELAVNVTDKRLFTKNSGGTVVELGTNPASLALPNGTANGVAYLNGSKVVTTGTALTFDGTKLGIGGAASQLIHAQTAGTTGYLQVQATSGSAYYGVDSAGVYIGSTANIPSIFNVNGSEQMRLTTTGLGIGTSSPLGTLGIAGSATTTIVIPRSSNGTTATPVETQLIGSAFTNGTYPAGIYALNSFTNNSGNWLAFKTTDTGNTTATRMTLDSSGNLGLGVTPSAWGSGKGIEVGYNGNAVWSYSQTDSYFTHNAKFTDAWRYNASAAASTYRQSAGAHYWNTAPSGTAGNAITFTQAMTLDASGRLGVGITSPGYKFSLQGGSSIADASMQLSVSGSVANQISFSNGYGQPEGVVFLGDGSSGNTSFGVISTQTALTFATAAYNIGGSSNLSTGWTERARIDSSGRFLVGTTSASIGAVNCAVALDATTVNSGFGMGINGNASNTQVMRFAYAGTAVGSIAITTSTTAYNTTSDYRLKDNQQPLTGSGEFIDALQPKTWDWKADGSKGVGFIAHEVQEVSPNSVVGEKDGEQMQAMEYGSAEFIANIIAELQSLRKRVAQLEAK